MIDWIKNNKMYLMIGGLIIGVLGVLFFFPLEKDNVQNDWESDWIGQEELVVKEVDSENNLEKQEEVIVVDVKGAVKAPGVYEGKTGDRVLHVIDQAGGLLEEADETKVNFALKLVDEMVIYIPVIGEESEMMLTGEMTEAGKEEGKVNLNSASEAELQTLPGIGPAKAAAIMEYRTENGSFKSVEELMEISGIGEKTFEKLKESITVR
jgi:competence protein ComEA